MKHNHTIIMLLLFPATTPRRSHISVDAAEDDCLDGNVPYTLLHYDNMMII